MPRCKVCNQKFEPKYFLQKHCNSDWCEKEFKNRFGKKEDVLKLKKCKGVGVAEGFGCGKMVPERKYGIGIKCCYEKWQRSEQGKKKQEKSKIKSVSEREKFGIEKDHKIVVDKLQLEIEKTREIVHKYIRKRDEGKPCISCGKKWESNFQAGHFFKAELYSGLRFDERNIHGQCPECNLMKDGNTKSYAVEIISRIGSDNLMKLTLESAYNKQYKYSKEELREIMSLFKAKIKDGR